MLHLMSVSEVESTKVLVMSSFLVPGILVLSCFIENFGTTFILLFHLGPLRNLSLSILTKNLCNIEIHYCTKYFFKSFAFAWCK